MLLLVVQFQCTPHFKQNLQTMQVIAVVRKYQEKMNTFLSFFFNDLSEVRI